MITKTEYIKLYGEDEWSKERKRRNNYMVQYRKLNKERIADISRKSKKKNKDVVDAINKKYYLTKIGRAKHRVEKYNQSDLKKGFDIANNIDEKWIIENIFTSKCIYCGDNNWLHLGADRINNNLPHAPENCVCACGVCNVERQCRKMSVEEFVEYRKTNPRDKKILKLEEVVEINGIKVIRKKAV